MQFGITLKPDISLERIVGLTRQAEKAGFEYGWIFDSHVIWMEPFPLMTLIAANTKKMHIGPCVTNPAVRDVTVASSLFATLNLISNGRMQMGIGRGDSSRRVLTRQLGVEVRSQRLALLERLFEAGDLGHQGVGRLALALGNADLLAERLAPGLDRLALGNGSTAALVDPEQLGRQRRQVALLQAGIEGRGMLADESYVVHG